METLEVPVLEKQETSAQWPDRPPRAILDEQELDAAAFRLWREASRLDIFPDE